MTTITVPNSRAAIKAVKDEIIGKRLTIRNLFAGQNLLVEKTPGRRHMERRLKADCCNCLEDAGYARKDVFARREPMKPMRLERCRAALGGKTSTILLEMEGGAEITLALAEGCRGGFGTYDHGKIIPFPENLELTRGVDWMVFEDSEVVPAAMRGKFCANETAMGLASTGEFWENMGLPETPVADVRFMVGTLRGEWEPKTHGSYSPYTARGFDECDDRAKAQLEFFFANEHGGIIISKAPTFPDMPGIELILRLGSPFVDPLLWVEIRKVGETRRYEIDCGFRPLLFSGDDTLSAKQAAGE